MERMSAMEDAWRARSIMQRSGPRIQDFSLVSGIELPLSPGLILRPRLVLVPKDSNLFATIYVCIDYGTGNDEGIPQVYLGS